MEKKMWSRFDYSRRLVGMTLIVLALGTYFLYGGKSLWVLLGGFLLLEHYFVWDRWDFYDYLLGHEWWGLYIIVIAFFIMGYVLLAQLCIFGFLIGATYNKFNPFKEFIPTIKEVFQ